MQWGFGVNLVKILLNSYQCIREFVHWDRGLIDPIASRLNTLLLICYLAAPRPTLDLCRWGSLTNLMLTHFSPVSHFIPSENVRKSLVFWHFQGVKKCDTGLKWVNEIWGNTLTFVLVYSKLEYYNYYSCLCMFICTCIC